MARKKGTGHESEAEVQEPTHEAAENGVESEDAVDATPDVVAPEVDEEAAKKESAVEENRGPRMFRIIINEQDNWDHNNDVPVTDPSTGVQYLIKRNEEVVVPEGVVNNLRESVIEQLEYDEDGNEKTRRIPRFSFQVLGEEKG
jgi:hypothetical protein